MPRFKVHRPVGEDPAPPLMAGRHIEAAMAGRIATLCDKGDGVGRRTSPVQQLFLFASGASVGHLIAFATQGGSAFALLPLLASFEMVRVVAGSQVADAHHWLSYVLAAVIQGLFLMGIYFAVSLVWRRVGSRAFSPGWTFAIALGLQIGLLLIPGGKE